MLRGSDGSRRTVAVVELRERLTTSPAPSADKLPSGLPSSDEDYSDGSKGILKSSNGKPLNLSGGGLKEQVTKQICDKILAQGKSLL